MSEQGLIVIHTGDGKGKTTAALGVLFRALGRKMKCGVVQFLKGNWETGERLFAQSIPDLDFYVMGLGFTWESHDLNQDQAAARAAWEKAKEMIQSERYQILVLDEIMYAFHFGWLDVHEVIAVLKNRPKNLHVILTGRKCPEELKAAADLVSEIHNRKHPFDSGIPAQKGVDY
ncbi:MAG: cob(I)yrinic acid a,c-diamide adenosyltransferase [Bdellovibrionia bacterium]